jgi:hypothetical protein
MISFSHGIKPYTFVVLPHCKTRNAHKIHDIANDKGKEMCVGNERYDKGDPNDMVVRRFELWMIGAPRKRLLVGMPSEPPDTQLLCLNCFVDGDLPNHTCPVEILKSKNVGILKKVIKEERSHRFENVDASDLDLFLVSGTFLIDDLASNQPPSNGKPLRPNKRLT